MNDDLSPPEGSPEHVEALIQSGHMREALDATLALLGSTPEPGTAVLAAILQCQLGHFDAALGTLETLASQRAEWRTLTHELSLCVVADKLRTERLHDPDVATQRAGIAPPPAFAQAQLEAAVYHARGEHDEAAKMLEQARQEAPPVRGRIVRTNGAVLPFDDLRDSDDLTGAMLQAIGPRGLLDIPFVELTAVVFRMPRTYHDVLWLAADLETRSGHKLTVRIPALYPDTAHDESPAIRNGSMAAWNNDPGYAVAIGQRELRLTSEGRTATVSLRQLARLDFE